MYSEITKTAKIYLRVPVWEENTAFNIKVQLNVVAKSVNVRFKKFNYKLFHFV